jgi:hypothetical protein
MKSHFCHYSTTTTCTFAKGGGGESKEHILAKFLLYEHLCTFRCATINAPHCNKTWHPTVPIRIELPISAVVKVEMATDGESGRVIYDVHVCASDNTVLYGFEIFKTHRTEKPRYQEWWELVAQEVIALLSEGDVNADVVLQCKRYQNQNAGCGRTCQTCVHDEKVRLLRFEEARRCAEKARRRAYEAEQEAHRRAEEAAQEALRRKEEAAQEALRRKEEAAQEARRRAKEAERMRAEEKRKRTEEAYKANEQLAKKRSEALEKDAFQKARKNCLEKDIDLFMSTLEGSWGITLKPTGISQIRKPMKLERARVWDTTEGDASARAEAVGRIDERAFAETLRRVFCPADSSAWNEVPWMH